MGDIALRVEGLGKRYRIGTLQRYKTIRDTLAEAVSGPFREATALFSNGRHAHTNGRSDDVLWALKDVSFEVERGEVIGIIGRNGAGKSTLLKILSRITEPTTGCAELYGRVGSLLEVGTGFHPELTGRENIYLNGAILGMTRREITRKFDEIVAFAEIERFLDTPIKQYSSGMYVRLAFAVAAHLESEILLVDEVLAVGDIAFQRKCLARIEGVAKEGRTVVIISHDMQAIRLLCTTCFCLQEGRVIDRGPTSTVIANYLASFEVLGDNEMISDEKRRHDYIQQRDVLKITRVSVRNSQGEPTRCLFFKESFTVQLYFEVLQPVSEVRLGLGLSTLEGLRIATVHHPSDGLALLDLAAGRYCVTAQVQNPLTPGQYTLIVGAHELKHRFGLEHIPLAASLTVMDVAAHAADLHDHYNIGLVSLQAVWTTVTPV